ncbi:MAG: hypothetical protein K2X31_05985 [Sphingopyxis sp.]|nr:hypothetical protein [Sphingopyxis sp.]
MSCNARILLFTLAIPLAACASAPAGEYPSLARRPIERSATVPPAPPVIPDPPPASATLIEAVRALGADANRGDAEFRAALSANAGSIAAARGAATGSEAWAQGETALSRVIAARGATNFALAELDRLAITRAEQGDVAGLALVEAEQARVAALVRAQDDRIAAALR